MLSSNSLNTANVSNISPGADLLGSHSAGGNAARCAPLRRGAELQHTHISPSLVSSANTISSSLPSNGDAKENETPD